MSGNVVKLPFKVTRRAFARLPRGANKQPTTAVIPVGEPSELRALIKALPTLEGSASPVRKNKRAPRRRLEITEEAWAVEEGQMRPLQAFRNCIAGMDRDQLGAACIILHRLIEREA